MYFPEKVTFLQYMYLLTHCNRLLCENQLQTLQQDYRKEHIGIMGSFNENILSIQDSSYVHNCLTLKGFIQHLQFPTADFATLLSYMYIKKYMV